MPRSDDIDVAVVGGGIIGIASAVALQAAGRKVLLIDRDAPGTGCSLGNAGLIASSYILPLASLALILDVPRMLLDPRGPLSLRARHLPAYAGWLGRFGLNALPARRRASIEALKLLNGGALAAWRNLLGPADSATLLRQDGMLDVIGLGRKARGLLAYASSLEAEGVAIDHLSPAEVTALEPALAGRTSGGILHRDIAQVTSPQQVLAALLARFRRAGGAVAHWPVHAIVPDGDRCVILGPDHRLVVGQAVIAAGWWSRALVEPLGLRAPVGAERGYHLMLPASAKAVIRPICFHDEAFIATPMADGLRLAGTVELAPPDASPDWRRADHLLSLVRHYLPDLDPAGATRWIGSRPSFPDSLPAIGVVPHAPQIAYAFGHQHLGLTQAAVTAEFITALLMKTCLTASLAPFDLRRFGNAKRVPSPLEKAAPPCS